MLWLSSGFENFNSMLYVVLILVARVFQFNLFQAYNISDCMMGKLHDDSSEYDISKDKKSVCSDSSKDSVLKVERAWLLLAQSVLRPITFY